MSQKDGDQTTRMEAWQLTGPLGLGVECTNQPVVRPVEEVATLYSLLKVFVSNHENITSVVSEFCWPLLNSKNSNLICI